MPFGHHIQHLPTAISPIRLLDSDWSIGINKYMYWLQPLWIAGWLYVVILITFCTILYLYYDERRDIRWNMAWAQGKSWWRSPRVFQGLRLYSRYILTQVIIQTLLMSKNDTSSSVLPGWAILVELIFCNSLAARHIFSSICPAQLGKYWKTSILENVGQLSKKYWRVQIQYYPF